MFVKNWQYFLDQYRKAIFTRDRFQTDPNGTGPKIGSDRPSVNTRPFWNRSGTDPNGSKTEPAFLQAQFWIHLDPFRAGSRTVPYKQKPIPFGSVRNGSCPVPCKRSLNVYQQSQYSEYLLNSNERLSRF